MIAARLTFLPWPTRAQRLPARRELRLASFNRDRNALLVYGEHGERRALRLTLPRYCDLRYYGDGPMPKDSTPVALGRTALHRPPCRQTHAQAEVLRDPDPHAWTRVSGPVPQPWEWLAFGAMCLDHADDDELARRLAEYQRGRRPEYDERRRQVEAEIEALSLPKSEADHKRKELEARFTTVRHGWRPGEKEFVLVFDVTLDDVKDGTLGLRNEYLAEEWARIHGFDLDAIQRDARAFHRWLGAVAYNAGTHVRNTGERGLTLSLGADDWEVLEASVRYELRFANGARVWLDGVEETATLMPEEVEDFDRLETRPASARRRVGAAKAGACSLRLGDNPGAARAIRRHLKERWRSLGSRGLAKAIRELKQGDWLDKNYSDVAPTVRALSDSTLRNLATGHTGRLLARNFKR